MKTPIYKRITHTLATASQLIIAAPVRLPPKVVAIAKYVSMGAALLEAVIGSVPNEDEADGVEEGASPEHEDSRKDVACNVLSCASVHALPAGEKGGRQDGR